MKTFKQLCEAVCETVGTPEEEDLKFHEALTKAGYTRGTSGGRFTRKTDYTHPTREKALVAKASIGRPFAMIGLKKFTRRSDLEKHLAAESACSGDE